jgi:hypothetical protein
LSATAGRGNDGLWKAWENDKTVFPLFPQPLEIDEADSHITTASTTTIMNISQTRQKQNPEK